LQIELLPTSLQLLKRRSQLRAREKNLNLKHQRQRRKRKRLLRKKVHPIITTTRTS
jgi:hypothetical protein